VTLVTDRSELRADCAACAGLCCVVPAFTVSSDFAIDKPSGVACPNLATDDFGCTIHGELRERGFPGCTVYDCFGAGQRVVQEHFGGREWRTTPEVREELFATFEVVERLHELLWYLEDAASRRLPRDLRDEVEGLRSAVEAAAAEPHERDVVPLQLRADALLGEVSGAVRPGGRSLRGHDLAGRDLRDEGLTDADLRGALLLGADLRDVDLGEADLLGADLRGADLRGADLSHSLFVTRMQVRAGRYDESTLLPGWAAR
jgi:Pentapeptide repeats (8 copies)